MNKIVPNLGPVVVNKPWQGVLGGRLGDCKSMTGEDFSSNCCIHVTRKKWWRDTLEMRWSEEALHGWRRRSTSGTQPFNFNYIQRNSEHDPSAATV